MKEGRKEGRGYVVRAGKRGGEGERYKGQFASNLRKGKSSKRNGNDDDNDDAEANEGSAYEGDELT